MRAASCSFPLLASLSTPLAAQTPPEHGIGLQEVLDIAIEAGTGIRLAEAQVEVGRGDLLTARSIYDGVLSVTGTQSRLDDRAIGPLALDTSDLTVSWSQRLRAGVTLIPSTFVSRTATAGASSEAVGSGGVDLTLVMPLLEDRGGTIGRLDEQAAEAASLADAADLEHERAATLLATASAYWSYLAAGRRLEVFERSEARADRLVEETGTLVEAGERPRADLNQVEANLASKRIERVAAEQQVHEARRALGVAMGLPADRMHRLPPAAEDFPPPLSLVLDERAAEQLVAIARRNRRDLEASSRLSEAALRRVEAVENDLRARLDLSLGAGYRGIDQGSGAAPLFGSLHRGVPGISAAIGMRYELPHRNTAARGQAVRTRALFRQQQVLHEELDRRVASAVRVAALALAHSLEQASFIEAAVSLSRATVANEKEKYGLGLATLFDVIQAEDNLTAALLGEIDIRLAHARALAGLRFETGTLVMPGEPPMADAIRFVTPPPM